MMSSMPSIHSCLKLSSENERIKTKYKKLQKRNVVLAKELKKLKEYFKNDEFFDRQGPTRSVQVQTERKLPISRPVTAKVPRGAASKQTNPDEQIELKSDKILIKTQCNQPRRYLHYYSCRLLSMHSSLMKRYQKELKTNTLQVEQIATLTLGNIELKQKLSEYQEKIAAQGKENEALQMRINNMSVKDRLTPSKREELKLLDRGFFEEIEDLKFALQQSAQLNTAYEAALKRLCQQFGVPLPSVTGSGKKRQKKRQQQREFR
ncbi:hypothetical protein QZH41_008205 [Actinostola sp. cb2023]|nr:hypothetical protein QZH41_008205 [Actinostola sp. cb2023]